MQTTPSLLRLCLSLPKCCGMSAVQIWRRRGGVVSSSLHKPSAADREVVRGVTEHSKWTSQTLRDASSGLPLMLPDLASGTERKCCRTRRGHRRSRPWSACQPADCGRVRGDRKEARESERKVILRTKEAKKEKKRGEKNTPFQWHVCSAAGPTNAPSNLPPAAPFPHQEVIPLYSHCIPSLSVQWSLRPSIPPSRTAECKANRPKSEWGSCQSLAAKQCLTGH